MLLLAPVEKKTKPQSARNTEKATTANPPSAKKEERKMPKDHLQKLVIHLN
jgi:hypothetical protein